MNDADWVRANKGRTFRRPNGTVEYTVCGIQYKHFAGRTFADAVCKTTGGTRLIPVVDVRRMKEIT
jgi:hypothetical protein